jgi:PhnB protein
MQAIPDGYHGLIPYLYVQGAARALDFYAKAFGAKERMRLDMPDGKLGHAEMELCGQVFMLADEMPEMGCLSPQTLGGHASSLVFYVENVDRAFQRALDAGAQVVRPVADQFYGDRSGTLKDPFGHVWNLMTHVEDVSEEEVHRRLAQMGEGQATG